MYDNTHHYGEYHSKSNSADRVGNVTVHTNATPRSFTVLTYMYSVTS